MTNLEKFYKYIFEEYNIINPVLTFDGDYLYGTTSLKEEEYDLKRDLLYLNAKVDKDGKNMYEQLIIRKVLYNFINTHYAPYIDKYFFPIVYNHMDEDGKGRHIEISLAKTIINLMDKSQLVEMNGYVSDNYYANQAIDFYRTERSKIKEVLRSGSSSEYYEYVMNKFQNSNGICNEEVLRKYLRVLSDLVYVLKCFEDLTKKPIIITEEEFKKCFDLDKLLMVMCKSFIINQKMRTKMHDDADSSFVLAKQVMLGLDNYGLSRLDTKIKVYDKGSKRVVDYTFKDLKREFDYYNDKYFKDKKESLISMEQAEKMGLVHDNSALAKLVSLLNEEEQQIISTEFDILAKGEGESRVQTLRSPNSHKNKQSIDEEELLYRKYIFENTDYVSQIVGKDKFNGYVGFIYENGLVVFERFYEQDGSLSKHNATYIMNYKNFINLIKLTKPEIMEYIKDGTEGIKRLYHRKNWANNLSTYIDSVEINDESLMFAHSMNNDQKVRKLSNN